jgi:hypothetical protein
VTDYGNPPVRTRRFDDVSTVPTDAPAPGPGEVYRFGPGVPVPAAAATTQAIAIWRGEAGPGDAEAEAAASSRRRRLASWLLPLLVLAAVIAILLWQSGGTPLAVDGATAAAAPQALTCGDTATVTATLHTNGGAGTIAYRWQRSDGTASDELHQQMSKGENSVQVVLLWAFHGEGTVRATATLDVVSPSPHAGLAAASFTYSCP